MKYFRIGIDLEKIIDSEPYLKQQIQAVFEIDGWVTYSSDFGISTLEMEKEKQNLLYCDIPRISGTVLQQEIDAILYRIGAIPCVRISNIAVSSAIYDLDVFEFNSLAEEFRGEIREDLLLAFQTADRKTYKRRTRPMLDVIFSHAIDLLSHKDGAISVGTIVEEELGILLQQKQILTKKDGDGFLYRTAKSCEGRHPENICSAVRRLRKLAEESSSQEGAALFRRMADTLRMERCSVARQWVTASEEVAGYLLEGGLCSTFEQAREIWAKYANAAESAA